MSPLLHTCYIIVVIALITLVVRGATPAYERELLLEGHKSANLTYSVYLMTAHHLLDNGSVAEGKHFVRENVIVSEDELNGYGSTLIRMGNPPENVQLMIDQLLKFEEIE